MYLGCFLQRRSAVQQERTVDFSDFEEASTELEEDMRWDFPTTVLGGV